MRAENWGPNPKAAGVVEFGGNYPGAYHLRRDVFMPWELLDVLGPQIAMSNSALRLC
jgi:asparagine synthase (glutamine-hydrolysing)